VPKLIPHATSNSGGSRCRDRQHSRDDDNNKMTKTMIGGFKIEPVMSKNSVHIAIVCLLHSRTRRVQASGRFMCVCHGSVIDDGNAFKFTTEAMS
jgi:hypothetical protein